MEDGGRQSRRLTQLTRRLLSNCSANGVSQPLRKGASGAVSASCGRPGGRCDANKRLLQTREYREGSLLRLRSASLPRSRIARR